jgi:hypothetical protein
VGIEEFQQLKHTDDRYEKYVTDIRSDNHHVKPANYRGILGTQPDMHKEHAGNAGARNALKTRICFCMNTNASFQDACSIANSIKHRSSLSFSLCER